jgi:MOSC domain-containing protein YiiM
VKIVGIHLAPGRRLPIKSVESVVAEADKGLVGDRYHGTARLQVTIQSLDDLDRASAELGHGIAASATRRNLTVDSGVLPTSRGTRLSVGDVELEVVRIVPPCRLLDDEIGAGAAAAMRGRGGTALRVLTSGTIRLGDAVTL